MSDEAQNIPRKDMSFLEHLEELRWKLVRISAVIVLGAITIFIFTEPIIETIFMGMKETDFVTYRGLCSLSHLLGLEDSLCATEIPVKLMSNKPTGQFSTNIFFCIVGAIAAAFPYIFWEIWGFIKPGLRVKEKKSARGIVFFGSVLFFMGIAFGYFIIAPLCVQFFGNFSMSDSIENIFTINSYLSLITTTTFFTGLFFQLPIVIYILSKLGIVTPQFLRKYRKHAIVVVLILSAIITPPDFISQVIVAIPVLILYEISIIISKVILKKKNSSK